PQSNWPFDVFLCHNSHDKSQVSEIAKQLQTSGLNVWLDEWELPPGQLWKQALDERLLEVGSVAVFVGPGGTPWNDLDVQAFLLEFARLNCPIIPVMLEEVGTRPQLPSYIQGQSWVDFRRYRPDPIEQLCERISHKQEFAVARPTLFYDDDEHACEQGAASHEYTSVANNHTIARELEANDAEYLDARDVDAPDIEYEDGDPQANRIESEYYDEAERGFNHDLVDTAESPIDNPQPTITQLHQGLIVQLADCINIEMRSIPAGTFLMGAAPEEEGSENDERPQHAVNVSAFTLATYPVTQAQWRTIARWPRVNIDLNPSPSGFDGDNRPVETITFEQAQEFCDRLTEYSGWIFRLPSEAEWEYACRSGTKTPYHFGDDISPETANTLDTHNQTTEVGQYPANGYGLYDMHGNVWEWCTDYWHSSYEGAPDTSKPWVDGEYANTRVLRGGSWDSDPSTCRSSYRIGCQYDGCDYFIGFRVVCDPDGVYEA
ncbi:MAG: SUMF1/EgtB/PvdO family nonheme iron enzyme, partial [Cyanobacteria bacterium P01_G01_bin.4]